jgi:hypothetical protein
VFDRERTFRAVSQTVKFDNIGPPGDTEPQGAERYTVGAAHVASGLGATAVDAIVLNPPLGRSLVLDP